jgi:SAM-dependent methyltransferase
MRQDERAAFDRALEPVRGSAYAPGEFVGQQSFMRAGEILSLAARAGVAPGVSVLDLCCGVAGPGRLVTRELGCAYLGVDASAGAIAVARELSRDLSCRYEVRSVPPLPPGRFDVVLLLETVLAFRDKQTLLREVSGALPAGGRFAFTLEEGRPLTEAERESMPDADTVWLVPLADMVAGCEEVGLRVRWQAECTRSHLDTVSALVEALAARAPEVSAQVGSRALDDLLAGHRLWAEWLRTGRVRKFAVVAQKVTTS